MSTCPLCDSKRIWKDGLRQTKKGEVQRYFCRKCGYRFSENHSDSSDRFRLSGHARRVYTRSLKRRNNNPRDRRICVTQPQGMKNLAKVETRQRQAQRGATKPDKATIKGKIVEFTWWLHKQGYPEATIEKRVYSVRRLVDLGADLWRPETVKDLLAHQQQWKDSYKKNIVYAYENFLEMEGLTWQMPHYRMRESLPFIPLEAELDQLVASTGKILGTFLQGLKDTGADPGELAHLRWIDINIQSRTVTVSHPVKNHNSRILTVSVDFISRLQTLPKRGERIFSYGSVRSTFYHSRKRIAYKLANPRIMKINFTSFRHWKATSEYHRTKDILYVMKLLGHKSIKSTMKYIDLEKAIFGELGADEFTVRISRNVKEACNLVEVGFEYVTGEYKDGGKIFRKRK